MKIFRPILSNAKTQGFGQSDVCVATSGGKVIWPYKILDKRGTVCPVNSVDFYTNALGMKGHNGEDWATYFKEKNYFSVIADTEWYCKGDLDDSGGIGIDIISKSAIDIDKLPFQTGTKAKALWVSQGNKLYVKFRYHHAKMNIPKDNTTISAGFLIQYADSTGASGGNHVHWSMKFCDEFGKTLDTDNGYLGAVNFSRWFTNQFILDALAEIKKQVDAQATVTPAEQATTTIPLKEEYSPTLLDIILSFINTFLNFLRKR